MLRRDRHAPHYRELRRPHGCEDSFQSQDRRSEASRASSAQTNPAHRCVNEADPRPTSPSLSAHTSREPASLSQAPHRVLAAARVAPPVFTCRTARNSSSCRCGPFSLSSETQPPERNPAPSHDGLSHIPAAPPSVPGHRPEQISDQVSVCPLPRVR